MYAIFRLVLALGLTAGPSAGATTAERHPVLDCDLLLTSAVSRAFQMRVAGIYARDDAPPEDSTAFVGLSPNDLLTLLNHGRVRAEDVKLQPYFNLEQAAVRGQRGLTRFTIGTTPGRTPREHAVRRALARTHVEILRRRFPGVDLDGDRVVEFLERLEPAARSEVTFSPTFRQLTDAIESSRMPKLPDPRIPRMRGLARRFGFTWSLPSDPASPTRTQFTAAFSHLPARGGVVVTLGPAVVNKTVFSDRAAPFVRAIDFEDVIAIDPLSDAEYSFLQDVTRHLNL